MNQFSLQLLTKLLSKSESRGFLKTIEKLLTLGIPFNAPHKFKLLELSEEQALMSLPFKRVNRNHLGTVHACALATLGEFPAGVLLIKHFSPSEFRVIMTKMEAQYHKHGVGELVGRVQMKEDRKTETSKALAKEGLGTIRMETEISDKKGRAVSTITTHWQLKNWNLIKPQVYADKNNVT